MDSSTCTVHCGHGYELTCRRSSVCPTVGLKLPVYLGAEEGGSKLTGRDVSTCFLKKAQPPTSSKRTHHCCLSRVPAHWRTVPQEARTERGQPVWRQVSGEGGSASLVPLGGFGVPLVSLFHDALPNRGAGWEDWEPSKRTVQRFPI